MSRPPPLDDFPEFEPGPAKPRLPPEDPQTSVAAFGSFVLGLFSIIPLLGIFTGALALLLGIFALVRISQPSNRLNGRGLAVAGLVLGAFGCLVVPALLFPAMQAAREAARRNDCMGNLTQITLSLHNYHEAHGSFPPAYFVDTNGRPTLSWRVAILPYFGESSLYDQFHLDEPWDSPHNRPLVDQMPRVFACPSRETPLGQTGYVAVTGPGTVFPGATPSKIADITDGLAHTLAVVESARTIPWTQPADFVFDPSKPDGGLANAAGSDHPGGFIAAFLDGHKRFFTQSMMRPAILRSLATSSGGEAIDDGGY